MRGKLTAHPFVLARNQARVKKQEWTLTRQEYDELWRGKEQQRGRTSDSFSLCRVDTKAGWTKANCVLMTRSQFRQQWKMNFRAAKKKQQEEK